MRRVALVSAALILYAGCPAERLTAPQTKPSPVPVRVLLFSSTSGFRHESIDNATSALVPLLGRQGVDAQATEDGTAFNEGNLSGYGAVVFLMTTGDVLDTAQQAAFENYIRNGGGFAGIHSATDTEYDWPFYRDLVRVYFKMHPAIQKATIRVTDRNHPSTAHLPETWTRIDEWYDFRTNPRGKVRVLATVDETTYSGGSMGADHPIAWCHSLGSSRAWYTAGGHTNESYAEEAFLQHLVGGISFAAGIKQGDCS